MTCLMASLVLTLYVVGSATQQPLYSATDGYSITRDRSPSRKFSLFLGTNILYKVLAEIHQTRLIFRWMDFFFVLAEFDHLAGIGDRFHCQAEALQFLDQHPE